MNNTINQVPKKNVEVIFIVPFGVDNAIFPWGIHLIRSYLQQSSNFLSSQVWDFRKNISFADINQRYSKLLTKLFLSLKTDQMAVFIAKMINPYHFFGVVASLGHQLFPNSSNHELINFQQDVRQHIIGEINDIKKTSREAYRIWAFSVYDNTLFNTLYIAQLIRENDPEATIVFGGDYFDFQNATEIINYSPLVDGIVVGYGEEVFRLIIDEIMRGSLVRDLQIQGLVNQGLLGAEEKAKTLMNLNIPPFYHDVANNHKISYVQHFNGNVIRVLTQRGCSWGRCNFCSQIDKDKYFSFKYEHLIQDIETAIRATKLKYIRLIFDADENNFELFLQLIKYLESFKNQNLCFEITLWLQVKSFKKELAEVLSKINNKLIRIHFAMNFESLNSKTLKNMCKGHTPLQAIEAAKVIMDCGHSYNTNYFNHYPLETRESIDQELKILRRVIHLFMPPKGRLNSFAYSANNRDALFQNQEKFNIISTHLPGDIFVSTAFGVNVPFSFWSYSYTNKPSLNLEHLLRYVYYQSRKAWTWFEYPRMFVNINWNGTKYPFKEQLAFLARLGKSLAWEVFFRILGLFNKGNVYQQRLRTFSYLAKVSSTEHPESKTKQSSLLISNNCLVKEYHTPWDKEKFSISLSTEEFKILRYLYWTRKYQDVIDQFKTTINELDIVNIIERHLKLGSLVQFRDSLLCTANDQEYWKMK